MLKRYGEQALKESAARATELTLSGDDDGVRSGTGLWRQSPSSPTPRPRSLCTDRERPIKAAKMTSLREFSHTLAAYVIGVRDDGDQTQMRLG